MPSATLAAFPTAPHEQWLLIGIVFVLAGAVKGVIGMGLPTLGMGLLGLTMAPAQAAALLFLPSLLTNLWQMLDGRALPILTRRLWPLLAGATLGTWFGAAWLPLSSAVGGAVLGVALSAYALAGLLAWQPRVPAPAERWLGPVIGAATGLVTAVTGVFAIPAVPYLQALKLDKDVLVQALGLAFTVSTLALGASLAKLGALDSHSAAASLLALLPALLGMRGGQWLRARLSPSAFRRCFFWGLLGLGLYLGGRYWW